MLLNYNVEDSLESPLECKTKPVHPKGNQSWIIIGKTDTEAETPILWPPDAMNWLTGKDPNVGKDCRREEKETRRWDGWMASLMWRTWVWVNSESCRCTGSPGMLRSMGCKESDTTEQWTELSRLMENSIIQFTSYTVGDNVNWCSHNGKQHGGYSKN